MYPNLRREKRLWKEGLKRVAGLDEAGRGPLAGPVVAAVTVLKSTKPRKDNELKGLVKKIKDSKKLTSEQRNKFYELLIKNSKVEWGIGRVSEKVIDKINILEATKLAMKRAIEKLKTKPDYLILDGVSKIDIEIPQKLIKRADEKVFSCSCASVLAKVYRDRIMEGYHKKYPQYCFDKHKGYPTKYHIKMLKKYGPCKIHRKSFNPVFKAQK